MGPSLALPIFAEFEVKLYADRLSAYSRCGSCSPGAYSITGTREVKNKGVLTLGGYVCGDLWRCTLARRLFECVCGCVGMVYMGEGCECAHFWDVWGLGV